MAIKNNFNKFGTTFANAYHRIDSLSYHVSEIQMNVEVAPATVDEEGVPVAPVYEMQWTKTARAHGNVLSYSSQEAREAHAESFARTPFDFAVDLSSDKNWMEQAYDHLKTLDAFEGATDIL